MRIDKSLLNRAHEKCECCSATENLAAYELPASATSGLEAQLLLCEKCISEAEAEERDQNHWRCLNDSMWSEFLPVQVISWRMLNRVLSAGWSQDLLDMMYLDEESLEWAQALGDGVEEPMKVVHRDVNGVILEAGDSVVLIKDLKVKGSSMIAKQGTAIRRISLDQDNETYIEGKVDGKHIVIITQFVKKI